MATEISLDFLISLKERLDSWRKQYDMDYLKRLSDEEAKEYNLMITIKEETLLENGKKYFGNISLKEIEAKLESEIKRRDKQKRDDYFDKVIPLKKQYDKDKSNKHILDLINILTTSYYENVMCFTQSSILAIIDKEIKARKIKAQKLNSSCEKAIADLERKISNPEGDMEDKLWKTRNFYDKRNKATKYSDTNGNKDSNEKDATYSIKGN